MGGGGWCVWEWGVREKKKTEKKVQIEKRKEQKQRKHLKKEKRINV